MFRTLEVPILGVIENMRGEFFGAGGGDTGEPVLFFKPDSEAAKALKAISEQVAARVSVTALEQKDGPTINVI